MSNPFKLLNLLFFEFKINFVKPLRKENEKVQFGDAGVELLCMSLPNNKLTTLDLSNKGIGDVGVATLFTVLQKNTSVTLLNLSGLH